MSIFQISLKKFLKEIGKVEPRYKKLYKESKIKKIKPLSFIHCVDENIDLFMNKDLKWFSVAYPTSLPIDCSSIINSSNETTMWKHIYSLYISALKNYDNTVTKYIKSQGQENIPDDEDKKRYFKIALKVYNILLDNSKELLNDIFPESLGNLALEISKDFECHSEIRDFASQNTDAFTNSDPNGLKNLLSSISTNSSLQDIFSKVSSKIQKKIENKEIDPEKMAKEAEQFLKKMNLQPMLENLKKNNK